MGGLLASLLAVLLIYIFRKTVFKPVDDYQIADLTEAVASRLTDAVRSSLASDESLVCFSRWNDIDWKSLLRDAHALEFFVSYMDTWVAWAHDPLLDICRRGGSITAYLPNPSDRNAQRVLERFPEYNAVLIKNKIVNTGRKLQAIAAESGNADAIVNIFYTNTFIMHCLMRLDGRRVLLSPFDHFRRGNVEGPAWLVDTDKYKYIGTWADKEFAGFRSTATSSSKQ